MKKILVLLLALVGAAYAVQAQSKNALEKVWYNQEKTSKIRVYKGADGLFYGQIIWMQDSLDSKGALKFDVNNVEESQRGRRVMRLVILNKFKSVGGNVYEDGTVYDPKAGKTYCAKLTLDGNTIKLKGFICGFPLLGRTSTWTLAEKP